MREGKGTKGKGNVEERGGKGKEREEKGEEMERERGMPHLYRGIEGPAGHQTHFWTSLFRSFIVQYHQRLYIYFTVLNMHMCFLFEVNRWM